MMISRMNVVASVAMVAAVALWMTGCNQAGNDSVASSADSAEAEHGEHEHGEGEHGHSHDGEEGEHDHAHGPTHGGWWCYEHGIPEEECSMCDADVAADFKAKGDWCEEHNRADSQCFICHPELKQKFVALYEAKYGEKPPEPTE